MKERFLLFMCACGEKGLVQWKQPVKVKKGICTGVPSLKAHALKNYNIKRVFVSTLHVLIRK